MDQVGPFPLREEDTGGCRELQLDDQLTQLVTGETVGQLVEERHLGTLLRLAFPLQLLKSLAPTGE